MKNTWISIVSIAIPIVTTMVTALVGFARAAMTGANFFTYRYEQVLKARKARLDIANHLEHLGFEDQAQEQREGANFLVVRAALLTRETRHRKWRNRLALWTYATASGGMAAFVLTLVLWGNHSSLKTYPAVAGVILLAVATILLAAYEVAADRGDKQISEKARELTKQLPHFKTYPTENAVEDQRMMADGGAGSVTTPS